MKWTSLLAALVFAVIPAAGAPESFYLGTYTGPSGSRGIYEGTLDDRSGRLGPLRLAATATDPSFLALRPDGSALYAAEERPGTGSVAAWRRGADGRLAPLGEQSAQGNGTCYVSVDATGGNLLAANYGTGSVVCFHLRPDGSIGDRTALAQVDGSGPNRDRQAGPHAHSIYSGPDNAFVYVCDLGTDCIWIYRFTPATGKLALSYPPAGQVAPGSGPRHLAFSRDGRIAYVASEMAHSVTVFAREASDGMLTPLQVVSALPAGISPPTTTAEIALHPSGKWLYVSNRGSDTLAVFAVAPSGRLNRIQIVSAGVKGPRSFAIDPSGRWIVTAGQNDNRLTVLRINPASGRLRPTTQSAWAPSPVCVLFAPAR